jgi:hypothetical protein
MTGRDLGQANGPELGTTFVAASGKRPGQRPEAFWNTAAWPKSGVAGMTDRPTLAASNINGSHTDEIIIIGQEWR